MNREELVAFGQKLACSLDKKSLTIKDLGTTWPAISKEFSNLQSFLEACGLIRSRRPPSMSNDEWKKFLIEIKSDTLEGCWVTSKYRTDKRYDFSTILVNGKRMALHRLSYYVFNGLPQVEITATNVIMHKCNNGKCFNPEHLQLGTQKENIEFCYASKRHPRVFLAGTDYTKHSIKRHKITNPYAYAELIAYIKKNVFITNKNEWLYKGKIPRNGYPNIAINYKSYVLPRLILANKLNKSYKDIEVTRHILPDGSIPNKHDLNPDHLFEGTFSENACDALKYKKGVYINYGIANEIRKDWSLFKGSVADFDKEEALKYNTTVESVRRVRLGITFVDN